MFMKCGCVVLLVFALLCPEAPAMTAGESLETLLAYLKSPNPSTRRDAARKLGERRAADKTSIEALLAAATKDDDRAVRAEAVHSLGLTKSDTTVPGLISCFRDSEPDVRKAAVKSLVILYTETDIDFITNRRAGWNLINPFLDTDDHEVIEPYVDVDPSIISALGECARGDHEREVRISAIRALGVLRAKAAIPQLGDALNADQEVRIDVLRTFIKIGDFAAGPYLISFFRDTDRKVRTQAMAAAGLLKYRPAVEPLLEVYGLGPDKKGVLTSVGHKIKGRFEYMPARDEAALWALSLIGDEKALHVFAENMNDKDGDRRQYAFEGLARAANPKYSEETSRLLPSESNDDVKLAQYWAIYRMGSTVNIQNVVRELDGPRHDQARGYLLETPNPADLYPYIQSGSKTVRLRVIEILGRIGDAGTVRELEPSVLTASREESNAATLAKKRIEWRMTGRPNANDDILRRDSRPRKASNP